MPFLLIPTTDEFPDYDQFTNLDDGTYTFRCLWNGRDSSWYLTISDAQGNVIVAGQRVRVNFSIFEQQQREGMPKGIFGVFNTRGDYGEPGRNDFRTKAMFLGYITADEL